MSESDMRKLLDDLRAGISDNPDAQAQIDAEVRWMMGLRHSLENSGEQSKEAAAEMIGVIQELSAGGQLNALAMLAAAILSTAAKDRADAEGGLEALYSMMSHQMQAHLAGLGKG